MSGSVLANAFDDANKPTVKPADYMEQLRQAGQVVQGLNANRLFQANTARGQIMAQATDENGIYHPDIANRLAAGRPDAAQAMPAIVGQNQDLSGQQLDQAMKRLGWIDSTAGAALTAGDYSDGAMLKMFHNGVAAGVLSLPDVQKQMATMPPDAAGRKAWLEQHQGQAATVQQQLELRYGKPEMPDTGGYKVPGTTSVQTGAFTPAGAPLKMTPAPSMVHLGGTVQGQSGGDALGGGLTVTPGPEYSNLSAAQRSQLVKTIDTDQFLPDGKTPNPNFKREITVPLEEMLLRNGVKLPPLPQPGGNPLLNGQPDPVPGSGDGNPAMGGQTEGPPGSKATPVNDADRARTAALRAAQQPPRPAVTSLAPGEAESDIESAKQSAQAGDQLVTRADQVPNNRANYGNMLADLSKLDTMGPGTGREATINAVVQKLAFGYGITMDKKQVAGAESFAKIANMIAAQQLGALGPTDARQSLAMGANPHLDLSKLGNTQILHMLQGNEDAIDAKARAWKDWVSGGHGTNTYRDFSIDFNHHFDPRVFQQQYMGDKEIGDLRRSLSATPGAAAKFADDVAYARQQKWIK